jgi:hypothetical protein
MTQTLHLLRDGMSTYERFDGASSGDAVPSDLAGRPTVVVRRRRTVVQLNKEPTTPLEPQPRSPQVFRVAALERGLEESTARGQSTALADSSIADDSVVVPVRRRRRLKPAPVTIIRPNEGAKAYEDRRDVGDAEVEEGANLRFGQSSADHRRYLEIQQEIERLRQEAEALKQLEAAAAVIWIRKAIRKHGIDLRDLGL